MLCCLSSVNFPKECKKGVNCIKSRIVIIRKKKQAMLRCLRKDVADLLANGHDTEAFGRIQELIVEMNLASCYDMIERYCECILQQLPSLQKKRECSEKAMEAMSTLIFAAARFSDLPELCDLRHVFTERYGNQMKSSINREFVEKAQKKSFSMDKKLQVMQGIAEEFSVSWDSKAFQQKNSDQPKRQSDLIGLVSLNAAEDLGSATNSFGCDEEEEAMERLLVYYSKKGMNNETSNTRTTMRAPTELVLNADRDRSFHHNNRSFHHNNGRVYPGLGEPVPSETTNGGLVHPKLPDCDGLAAKINALRKT